MLYNVHMLKSINTKTKIVCTIGPSTNKREILECLINNGMNVARINLSHGEINTHKNIISKIKSIRTSLDVPIGIMIDLPGSKLRLKTYQENSLTVANNQTVYLSNKLTTNINNLEIPHKIYQHILIGDHLIIADGLVNLIAEKILPDKVICKSLNSGEISHRKSIYIKDKEIDLDPNIKFQQKWFEFIADMKPDFVAVSMVNTKKDILLLKKELNKLGWNGILISKIETKQSILNLDEILQFSDGVMVARGDMGLHIPIEEVPIVQKNIITKSNKLGIPVITATQMLESMIYSPIPTRAEVTDIANAILDGTDAIMLSGETAIGKFPMEAVKMMSKVANVTEQKIDYQGILSQKLNQLENAVDDSIAYNASHSSLQINADVILAFTESGATAMRVSKYRPKSPIIALTNSKEIVNKLTLFWGINAGLSEKLNSVDDFFSLGENIGEKFIVDWKSNLIVLIAGLPIGVSGETNLLRIIKK
mgnify:FL=1